MASWRVWSANTLKCYTLCYGEQRVLCRSDGPMPMSWQCIITIGNDGAGTVTSVGMGSTGVRENTSTPWVWLRKNQRKVIANGTMVSLDINNPEGHVFTLCQVVENKQSYRRNMTVIGLFIHNTPTRTNQTHTKRGLFTVAIPLLESGGGDF
jgi:hypothetical protein